MDVILRSEAKKVGLVHYFTGVACCRGHIDPRNTKNGKCMGCDRVHHQADYDANPGAIQAKNNASYARNKIGIQSRRLAKRADDRKKARDDYRRWYYARRDEICRQRAERYASNPYKIRATVTAYAREHPEIVATSRRNRRARKAGNGGRPSAAQLVALAVKQRFRCACGCRKSIKHLFHADHIKPLVLGGTNDIRNIQLLTPHCNLSKHAKDPIAWAQSLGRLI